MKNMPARGRMGMAVIAGGLAFVGSADATQLLLDGSFENVTPTTSPIVKTGGAANPGLGGGWSTFSTYLYSTEYALPGPAGSGANFLRPYANDPTGVPSSQTVTQLVSLTVGTTLTPAKIDAGSGKYAISSYFSSYLSQGDYSTLTLEFLNDSDAAVGDPVDPLGGLDFVAAIPQAPSPTGKYPNAKDWAQDLREGTIPTGARKALVTIQSTAVGGQPDGYVDVVSLDVTDTTVGTPSVKTAIPENKAVGVGPLVSLTVVLQDATTAVNTNSIQLLLDNAPVPATIQQTNNTTTLVTYSAGLLQAISQHDYKIIFGDTGTPAVFQTNQFRFTVADYVTLPSGQGSPLGSEDTTKPGFSVTVYQVDPAPLTDPAPTQINAPPSISFSEAMLAGAVGPNIADLTGAAATNTFAVSGVINYANSFPGAVGNFQGDTQFPGLPGTSGSEDSVSHEIITYIRFPAAGYYQLGVNNADQLRVTAAVSGVQAIRITAPTNMIIPSVVHSTNINGLAIGASLPTTPLTGQLAYATPSGNPDDSCVIGTNTSLAGKIVLLDRGGTNCNSAVKAEQAQQAGAIAVIQTTPDDFGFPFRLGDASTIVHIPFLVIGDSYGGSVLKSYATNGTPVTLAIQGDPNPRLTEWDGPKGFGAVDQLFGFAVPAAGVYPMRVVVGQESQGANLEWFSIKPDGSRVLLNDTADAAALRTFRARTAVVEPPKFNPVVLSNGTISLSWTGTGTLQETTSFSTWTDSTNQSNPQTVPVSGTMKFYRIKQ